VYARLEDPVTMNPAELRRAFENKIKRGIFNPVARHLHEDIREDRMQDALAQTWAMYERYAERGEILDDALLVHACRLRAIDLSRHYVPSEGYQRKRDVLDPRNYHSGRVEVLRFCDVAAESESCWSSEEGDPFAIGFAEKTSLNPHGRIVSAINLLDWLEELPAEDRRMLELRASGYTLEESAAMMGLSTSTIFAKSKRLGLALAERAGARVELKKKRKGRAPSVSKVELTGQKQGPISEVIPVKKAAVRRRSRASTPKVREMTVAA